MPDNTDGIASLPRLLLRSRVAVAGRFNRKLRQHGLTEQQWRVLRSLVADDFAEVTKLAERVDLLPSSLSRILRDLDARQLVVRMQARSDGRRTLAIITPQGRKLVDETMADIATIHADIDNCFGKNNVLELQIRLAALIAALESGDDPADRVADRPTAEP